MAGNDTINLASCMVVINNALRNYQDYSVQQLRLLDEIDEYGTGLGGAALLLRSPISLLVKTPTSNEQTIAVHPLARPALKRFRRKKLLQEVRDDQR